LVVPPRNLRAILILSAPLVAALVFCRGALAPVCPTPPGETLYEQEGTEADGYLPVNAGGKGPAGDQSDNWTNWKYQYGSASWSAVYSAGEGWVEEQGSGEMRLRIEADIEVYSWYGAGSSGQTSSAQVTGTLTSNTGQYVGISLSDERAARVESNRSKRLGSVGSRVSLAMRTDAGAWRRPDLYHISEARPPTETAWWLVKRGSAGSFALQWCVFFSDAQAAETASPEAPTVVVASVL